MKHIESLMHTPLSKQRNKHIQRALVEAAKLAPRQDHELALVVYEIEKQMGHANRAALALARKICGVSFGRGSGATGLCCQRRSEADSGLKPPPGGREKVYTAQTARSRRWPTGRRRAREQRLNLL